MINTASSAEVTAGNYARLLAPMPPISLAYVAAALKQARIDVSVYDDYTERGGRDTLFDRIRKYSPDVVGLSCVTVTAPRTFEIAAEIRNDFPDIRIVMGNIHPSVFYEDILNRNLADAVVLGEGEVTAVKLVEAWASGGKLDEVKGIAFRDNGSVKTTGVQDFVADLDSLPFPAWELFPVNRYRIFSFASVKEPGTLILGSRGCPFNCTFCSLKIMGRRRRRRSSSNIADEFEYLHGRFGYVQPSFIDPIFPLSKKEAFEFSEELIKRGLEKKMIWITETRVDLVDEEMLKAMRRSGLRRIMYGFESGTQEGIDIIRKNFTVEQARKAVEATRRAGVEIIGFFMIGVPGDSVKSIEETIKFAASLDIDFAKFTVFSPFPGTAVYDEMLENGTIPPDADWEHYTNYPSKETPAVFIPQGVTNDDLIRLQRKALVKFYIRPKMIFRHLFRIRTLRLKDILDGVAALMKR